MGSRSRARKRYAKERDGIVQRVAASATPRVQLVKELGKVRMHGEGVKIARPKPGHVLAKEASGHQYVGGSRARGVSLTRSEKAMNQRERAGREAVREQGSSTVDTGRGNQRSIVSGREVQDRDLSTVKVSYGEVKRLTKQEQRQRLLSGGY